MEKNIVDKIKKLLALANKNSNDNEAQSALLMAQELMAKHNIEQSQLEDLKKGEVIELATVINKGVPLWKAQLAMILAKNFRCEVVYISNRSGGQPNRKFIGFKEDVEMCNLLLQQTIDYVVKRQKEYWLEVKDLYQPWGWREVQRNYALGFVTGLSDKLRANRENNDWGLVVVTPPEVKEFTFNKCHGRTYTQSYRGPSDNYSYDQGLKEGGKYNFTSGDMPLNKLGGE